MVFQGIEELISRYVRPAMTSQAAFLRPVAQGRRCLSPWLKYPFWWQISLKNTEKHTVIGMKLC